MRARCTACSTSHSVNNSVHMSNTDIANLHAQYWRRMIDLVEKYGFAKQYVIPDIKLGIPSVGYTIGLCNHGLPDLLVFGLPGDPSISALIIDTIVHRALKGDLALVDGQIIHEAANLPLQLRAADPDKGFSFALGARRYAEENGHTAKLLQILLPDVKGRFPGDASCDPRITQMQDINYLRMKDQVRNMVLPI